MEEKIRSFVNPSFHCLNNYASVRAIAVSAGDMSVLVRQEVRKILEENNNSILKSLTIGLEDLQTQKVISLEECNELKDVNKHLLYAVKGKEDGEEAFFAIRDIYQKLLKNHESSPTALAIASVAASAFNFKRANSVNIRPGDTASGAIVGAVIGAGIGVRAGGFVGAAIGAAVGGAAGAAIGWCNQTGNGND